MGYYDWEDYYEPSEFDEMVEEFKTCLRDSVKQEIQDDIQRLKKENEEFQNVKNNWNSLEKEYKNKLRELENEIYKCKQNAARMRLKELFEESGMNVILFKPTTKYVYKPKCDKCDKDRYIHFKSPSGKDYKELCSCAKGYNKSIPWAYYCSEFRVNNYGYKKEHPLLMWYKPYRDYSSDYDGYTYDGSSKCDFVYNDEPFDFISDEYNTCVYFRDEKKCQEYCDYLNKHRGITDDMVER